MLFQKVVLPDRYVMQALNGAGEETGVAGIEKPIGHLLRAPIPQVRPRVQVDQGLPLIWKNGKIINLWLRY